MRAGASRRTEADDGIGVDSIGRIIKTLVREHVEQAVKEHLPLLLQGTAHRPHQKTPAPEGLREEYLTRQEAAQIAKCSVRTITRYIEAGQLRPCGPRRDRIMRSELDRFLQAPDAGESTRTNQEDPDAEAAGVVDRLLGTK